MAMILLYRRNKGVNCNSYSFPDDFTIVGHFLCDVRDVEYLLALPPRCWGLIKNPRSRSGYACYHDHSGEKRITRLAHAAVWERHNGPIPINEKTGKRFQIDHINQNGLDNRLENLRLATSVQQAHNAAKRRTYGKSTTLSKFKGVTWDSKLGKWIAQTGGKITGRLHLGVFEIEVEAAYAYNAAMSLLPGDHYVLLNSIPTDSISPARQHEIKADVTRRISSKLGSSPCESTTR